MILTGSQIKRSVEQGDIVIDPFDECQINPNSYNYRLGSKLIYPDGNEHPFDEDGVMLSQGTLVLGATYEIIGSRKYAMSLIGRSSVGRLGLFLQVSANLGHTGSCHRWTLEIFAAKSIRIYPHMEIGQISFWRNNGAHRLYVGKYATKNVPQTSLLER